MNRNAIIQMAKYGLLGLAAVIVLIFIRNKLFSVSSIPKALQLTYLPADFELDLDNETVYTILSNPYRYATEFEDLVRHINLALLTHVADRMNLNESQRQRILESYGKHHAYLKDLYFDDFTELSEHQSDIKDQWYANDQKQAIETLHEVLSKYTCFLVSHVVIAVLDAPEGKLLVQGKNVQTPCGLALTEGLNPMFKRLEEQASIADFSRSRGMIQEKSKTYIAELATVKVTEKKGINKQLFTKLFGINISSTEIEISALSIMKVGFNLDQGFQVSINQANKQIIVELPAPSILSHEVSPRIDKLDIGLIEGLDQEELNQNINTLRAAFISSSFTDEVVEMAKEKGYSTLETFFQPFLQQLPSGYDLELRFEEVQNIRTAESINF